MVADGARPGRRTALALAMVPLLLAGCGSKAPNGQVVAVVDGQDVTRRELAGELAAANLPRDADAAAAQPAIMDELVTRKLIVAQAKREGIDTTPEYLAAAQRADEILLAQQMASRWLAKQPQPGAGEIDAFIAANPQMFANRQLLLLDQVQTSGKGIDDKALVPLETMDAVIAYLRAHNHPFQRGRATLDTLSLTREGAAQILAVKPGVPFVTKRAGQLVLSVIVESRPAPVPENEVRAVAQQALARQNAGKAIAAQVKSLKAGAQISYQPGFAPAPAPAGTPAP